MTSLLNPYLSFDGSAREAMEFYQGVLGGELEVMTFGQYGGAPADGVMHARLETPSGFHLMAADLPEGESMTVGTNITLSLSGDDTDDLTGYFQKLSEGGTVTMPLEQQMWGDSFGMFTDRFGIGWMVNIASEGNPETS
ncbi:VOC family protein [Nocardioides sp.]|uniref:VOC family protein n=1 Tax=Nocardioides sp. TaxID=35761 RepID=UPI002ED5FDE5